MQPLKTTGTANMSSDETFHHGHHGTSAHNATLETALTFGCNVIDPRVATDPQAVADEYQNRQSLPATPTPPGVARVSSVDRLPESPRYEPITMADLWKIADRAHDVVSAARRHLPTGDPGKDTLFKAGNELLAVEFYTFNLRECAR